MMKSVIFYFGEIMFGAGWEKFNHTFMDICEEGGLTGNTPFV